MRGRLWLKFFKKVMNEKWKEFGDDITDSKWTESMKEVLDEVAEMSNCYRFMIKSKNKDEFHGEYLGIDCIYTDRREQPWVEDWCPPVPPSVAIEHENSYERGKILYCLWKILCVHADVKVLICYQSKTEEVKSLIEYMEDFIWEGGFMRSESGDLLLIIGDDSKSNSDWKKYFSIFEWRGDKLKKIALN
jgi:hypothetical protein